MGRKNKGFVQVKFEKEDQVIAIENPDGFLKNNEFVIETTESTEENKRKNEILMKQVWGVAKGPGASIFMNLFMLWMMGNNLHIFSIFMIGSMLTTPIKGLLNVETAFSKFKNCDQSLIQPKLTYIGINFVLLLMGLYKLYNMGLLPLSPSDYVDLIPRSKVTPFLISLLL